MRVHSGIESIDCNGIPYNFLVCDARPEASQCQVARLQVFGRTRFGSIHPDDLAPVRPSWQADPRGASISSGHLLFVHCDRSLLDPLVELVPTLQYRYIRGAYCAPMTVGEAEMDRFMRAVRSTDSPRYYQPGELTPAQYGRMVRIVGGPLDGYEGRLLSVRGSRVKRLLVDIPNLLVAGVEVQPEYIQVL